MRLSQSPAWAMEEERASALDRVFGAVARSSSNTAWSMVLESWRCLRGTSTPSMEVQSSLPAALARSRRAGVMCFVVAGAWPRILVTSSLD